MENASFTQKKHISPNVPDSIEFNRQFNCVRKYHKPPQDDACSDKKILYYTSIVTDYLIGQEIWYLNWYTIVYSGISIQRMIYHCTQLIYHWVQWYINSTDDIPLCTTDIPLCTVVYQ